MQFKFIINNVLSVVYLKLYLYLYHNNKTTRNYENRRYT